MRAGRASFLILGFFFALSASAATYTWNGGSAAWNSSASWTPARASVAATDVLVFNGGGSTTATSVPTETIGQLLVSNNTNVTLQSAGAVTVTIAGLAGTDLQVDAGSQLNFTGTANAITMTVGAGATGSISGSMTCSGTATVAHRLQAVSASGITFQNGAVFTQGTNFNGNAFGTTNLNSIVFASGSTFVFTTGSNPFGATQPNSVVVFQTGSLYKQQSSNTPAFSGRTYGNFEMVSGTVSPNGTSAVSIDNLTVTGGSLTIAVSGTPGHSIKGNISVAAGGTLIFAPNPANATTINLNGSAAQSITNAGTLTFNSAVETINVNNASGVTLGSSVTFQQGVLSLTSGNITTGANTLIINSGASVSRTSGHVIGNLRKDFAANGSKVFEVGTGNGYSPFTANVSAGTPGNITCAALQGVQPNMNPLTSIARYWALTASAGVTADLTFQYLAGDVAGNEAAYKVFRVSGGTPVSFPGSSVNTGTHTATVNAISSFSDWTVGEDGGPPPLPTLNVGDVTLTEGDSGTKNFNFTVNLTAPAGAGGVSFNWATADDSAKLADNDYQQVSLTPVTIPSGSSSATLTVLVNGDTNVEPNERFFVNITSVSNATPGDVQGDGNITNDDVAVAKIHDLQGNGATSPIVGSNVNIRGIVTGVKSNGFFVQEEDIDADADPNTSEGIFVFTSSAPPAAAAFTAQVQVNGTVQEFVPSSDPQQPPLTELSGTITVTQLQAPGQPLPTAVVLSPTKPDPTLPFDQMEKYEGMRVSATSITVTGPSDGSKNEANATGTSNGRFHGVVTGVARPFREPGIQAPDAPPTGSIPPIPRWDTNPERLRIESAAINSQPILTVRSNDVVGPIAGPLDYGFRGYAIYPDGTLGTPVVTPGTLNTIVTTPAANEFTIASFNLERFFDTTDDSGISDVALTAAAFNNRLLKASIAIRNHLKFPDIVGVQEVENLPTLQALAAQINNDAVANAQPNPMYVAYLSEGNDPGGIDVGYLVKTAPVPGGASRVAVNSVTQVGKTTTYIDPTNGAPDDLNDRPPLVLDATINRGPGASFNVVVINNHLRSLLGLTDTTVSGPTTTGDRVRRKRQIQADFLAQYIQTRLNAALGEHLVVIGDMNNFEFNDGYQDSLDTIAGTPVPDNQTVVCSTCPQAPNTGDGIDQLNPNLTNLVTTPPAAERYGYVFEGNAQNIDHALVSPGLINDTIVRRIEHPRIDTDYPETERNSNATAFRISDHDPIVAYFAAGALSSADVSLTKTLNTSGPFVEGQSISYTINVANAGPDPATSIQVTDTPANLTITNVSGACVALPCTIASIASGANTNITVTATINAAGAFDNSAGATAAETDPNSGNNSDSTGNNGTAAASASLSLTKTLDTAGPYYHGQSVTYTITVANAGPSTATNVQVTDTPTNLTITNVSGACVALPCTIASIASGANATITVTATINGAGAFDNSASATGAENDPSSANNSDNDGATAAAQADVSLTKSLDTAGPLNIAQSVTYTITVANAGPSTATSVQVTDMPTNLTITNVSGACVALPCTIASIASGGNAVITVTATINAAGAFDNSASASAAENDPNTGNNTDNTSNGGSAAAEADVSLTKTLDTAGPYYIGGTVTYTITVANAGPSTATSVQVTDTPANLTITNVSGACASLPCTIASIAASASANITVTATIDATGAFDNSATAATAETDPNLANNTDNTNNGGSAAPRADVSVTKTLDSFPPFYVGGDPVTYTVTVSNAGPSAATGVQIADTPTNLTITNVTGNCTSLPCTIVSIPAGGSISFNVFATINGAGAFDNSATASAAENDPSQANNTDNSGNGGVATSLVDVSLSKTLETVGSSYNVGQTVTYTVVVANAGPSPATSIQVTDTPTNLTITNVSGACSALPCSIASIAAGANVNFTITATITNVGVFDNSATATPAETDSNLANNTDNVDNGGTTGAAANISVVKSFVTPQPYRQGDVLTMNLVVSNAGPNTANNIVVKDAPIGLTVQNMTGGGCINYVFNSNPFPGNGTCTIPSLASGGSVNVTVTALASSTGQFLNTGTVTATEFDPVTSNNTSQVNAVATSSANLSVTKTLNTAGPYFVGQAVSYTIVALNSGPSPAVNVQLTDTPTNLTITSVTGGCTSLPCTIIPALLVGQPRTINVTATINAAGVFDNSASLNGPDFDPNTANNTDNTGNGGTAVVNPDVDGDGVDNATEQAAPNGGDGNGDGVPDYQQNTVTSIPAATGSGYLTLQSSCPLQQVTVSTPQSTDPGFSYPHGLIAFRAPCSSATFSLFVYGSAAANAYRKFGPLPPGGPEQWYALPGATFSTATVGSLHPRRIDFSLTDGGTGDDTPVDGVIVDQGGPANGAGDAPTLSTVMLMVMIAMMAWVALRKI